MKRIIALILLIFVTSPCAMLGAQNPPVLSKKARIYLVDVAPGPDLYAVYGHSSLWVMDEPNSISEIYDYGVFDFHAPDFYTNFLMGKMQYRRVCHDIDDFLMQFYIEGRCVKARQLYLDSLPRQMLYNQLWVNALPGNDTYHYDFVKDNCATQLQHMVDVACSGGIRWNYPTQRYSLKQLLHESMPEFYWTKFGYDLLLGAGSDTLMAPEMTSFLPKYLFKNFGAAQYMGQGLTGPEEMMLDVKPEWTASDLWYCSPAVVFGMLSLLMIILLYFGKLPKWTEYTWFVVLGLFGCLIFFMSNFTAHHVMKHNWNLLWTNPFLLIWPFIRARQAIRWVRVYAYVIGMGIALALLGYFFIPQRLPLASVFINLISLLLLARTLFPQHFQKFCK